MLKEKLTRSTKNILILSVFVMALLLLTLNLLIPNSVKANDIVPSASIELSNEKNITDEEYNNINTINEDFILNNDVINNNNNNEENNIQNSINNIDNEIKNEIISPNNAIENINTFQNKNNDNINKEKGIKDNIKYEEKGIISDELTSMYVYKYDKEQCEMKENINRIFLDEEVSFNEEKNNIDNDDNNYDGILTYLFPKLFAKARDCGRAYVTPAFYECCRENMKDCYKKEVAEERAYSIEITREMYCKFISFTKFSAENICFNKVAVPDPRIIPIACAFWLGLIPLDLDCNDL